MKGIGIEGKSVKGRVIERENEREKIERKRRFLLQFLVKFPKQRNKVYINKGLSENINKWYTQNYDEILLPSILCYKSELLIEILAYL